MSLLTDRSAARPGTAISDPETQNGAALRANTAPNEAAISPEIERLRDRLVSVRRDLHQHPEPGFKEVRTAGIVAARLQELGCRVRTGIARTGVVGVIGGGAGKTLVLRFDMDALPVQEATGASYASTTPGWMHACGHDGHTSIGLAVAEALCQAPLQGTVKLVFQPAEESPGGAKPMIAEGVLDDPAVDACLGLHLWTNLPAGLVAVRPGPIMANTDVFSIRVQGRGGHGAAPHQTCDALVAAAQIVTALQTIVSRNVDPIAPAVLTVGTFHSGSAHNIIADEAHLTGTIRTFDPTVQEAVHAAFERTAAGTAAALGATVEVLIERGYPAVVNDPEMTEVVRQAAIETVGERSAVMADPWMAGEDFSYFAAAKPSCYFFVGAASEARGFTYPHHSPHFDFEEDALVIATQVMVRAARRYLGAEAA